MSMLGELTFFLGLQIYQTDKWIFISQTKYIKYMLKIFKMEYSKPISTPMITGCKLSRDDESLEVDHTMYRSMIGSMLYVIVTRLDVKQVVGLIVRFQSNPKETHLTIVKGNFKYFLILGYWAIKVYDVEWNSTRYFNTCFHVYLFQHMKMWIYYMESPSI